MAPLANTPNYSLFSIPAYLIIAMAPHFYSTTLLSSTAKPKANGSAKSKPSAGAGNFYNMSNPRSTNNATSYASKIDSASYARWERARAAHNNMLENASFFISAIVIGIVTKCDAGYMNYMSGLYLASRVFYLISYINVSGGVLSLLRTVFWFVGMWVTFALWWEAGKKVMVGNY